MGEAREDDVHGCLMKKSKKRKKEELFTSNEGGAELQVHGKGHKKLKSEVEPVHDKKKKKQRNKGENVNAAQLESPIGDGVKLVKDKKKKKLRKEGESDNAVQLESPIDNEVEPVNDKKNKKKNKQRNEVVERVESVEDKKRKKKKNKGDLGASSSNKEIVDNTNALPASNGENTRDVGRKRKQKCVASTDANVDNKTVEETESMNDKKRKKKKKGHLESDSLGQESVGKSPSSSGVERKKKSFGSKDEIADIVGTSEVNKSTSSKKSKRVTFSNNDEYFTLPDNSLDKGKKKVEDDPKGNIGDDGLLRGKRFTKEEDELIKQAVFDYIEENQLGENGVHMVLTCCSRPEIRNCWKQIAAAVPYRPYMSIYCRGHLLFERSEDRKWTQEELDHVMKFYEKHGPKWKKLADEMGKHRKNVKDLWRRNKSKNKKDGHWNQDEYQALFDLVNLDLTMKVFQEKKSKHGMLRDNISWDAISEKLGTRSDCSCCVKWYNQLSSPLVKEGKWASTDDYRLLMSLSELDAACEEDVDWDNLLEHRSGELCRQRWNQMTRHIGEHGIKPFCEQVDLLQQRYCPELAETREAFDNRPVVD